MTVPADAAVARIPTGMRYEEAAPATEGWHDALANVRAARVRTGQRVLVHEATGSAAVQIVAAEGAHVTAVCDGEHLETVAGLGADRVIDRTNEDFTDADDTYDVVFDAVGKTTFGRCRRLLRPGGVFLTTDLGPWAQNPLLAVVTRFVGRKCVVIGLPGDDRTVADEVKAMMEAGRFRPLIDRTYPLDRIVDAYRYVETGQKIGNVVITVPDRDEPRDEPAAGDGTARPHESVPTVVEP